MLFHPLKERLAFRFLIVTFICILYPAVLFADADKIFKENNKAVVVIVAYDGEGNAIALGSGFIAKANGAVVTNYHVISNAKDIKIKAVNKILSVEGFLHIDKENDLVILKADGKGLPTVKIGDTAKANIGEKIYVIGNPQGLENTISDGILSGIREVTPQKKVLQITAPISAGSSGGPVFNKNGEVIGIATFVIKEAQNLNFAMPVSLVKDSFGKGKVIAFKDAGIEDYEKTAEYWWNIGLGYYDSGMYKEAIEAFKQAIRIKPDHALSYTSLGDAYYNSGMYKEAIETYKQAINIEPDYYAHFKLGEAYIRLGAGISLSERKSLVKDAIVAYKQAIRFKSDYADSYNSLGFAFGILDMEKEKIEACRQAIKIRPDYADAYDCLGTAYAGLHMYKESIEAYKQAIRIEPDNPVSHYNLGLKYIELGEMGMAIKQYKILKDLHEQMANKLFKMIYE